MSTTGETREGFYLSDDGEWVPEGWDCKELGKIVRLQRGHDLTSKERKSGDVPVMGSAGLNGYHSESKASGPGVVMGRSGASFGKVHYVERDYWPHNTCLYVTDFCGNDVDFIFRFLKFHDFTRFNSGSAQQSLNRNFLYAEPFRLPNITEQKSIADILGSLDNKIELLREQNETLEALAQTLFNRWFIDFNFPDEKGNPYKDSGGKMVASEFGEIPEGWKPGEISLFAEHLKNSVSPNKKPDIMSYHYSIPSFDNGMKPVLENGSQIKSNKYEVIASSILVSKLNPITPRVWQIQGAAANSVCSTEFQVVKPRSKYFGFVYGALMSSPVRRELARRAHGTSSSHQRVSPSDIFNVSFPVSADGILEKAFSETIHGLLTKADESRAQIQNLSQLRDTLLPRLMKGEIRVAVEA